MHLLQKRGGGVKDRSEEMGYGCPYSMTILNDLSNIM